MAFLKQFLIILCSSQFILGPVAFAGDITGDTFLEEQREACTGDTVEWNSDLNTCSTKQAVVDTKEKADACEGSDDPKNCYMKEAEEQTGVSKGQNGNDDYKTLENIAKVVALTYGIFGSMALLSAVDARTNATGGSGGLKSFDSDKAVRAKSKGCRSKFIYQVTTTAWVAGDYFLKRKAKEGFEDLAKEYEKDQENSEDKSSESSSYQSQVRAFTFLKQEQEKVKEQAKYRKILQLSVIAGFTAALFFSIKEIKMAIAAHAAGLPIPAGYCPGLEDSSFLKKTKLLTFMKRVGSSTGVMKASLIMLALNTQLIFHSHKEKDRAEKNIKNIDEIISTYSQYVSGFCPDGREDPADARCYCYQEDGTQHENRESSNICQTLFAADTLNHSLLNEKTNSITDGPRQGCLTVTGQFDNDCKCRKMINTTTKQNACAKSTMTSSMSSGLAANIGAANTLSSLNAFPQGASRALASLNEASLTKSAARNKKLVDSLIKKANKEGVRLPPFDQFEKRAKQLALNSAENKKLAKFSKAFSPIQSGSIVSNPKLSKALSTAKSRAKLIPTLASSGSGRGAIGRKSGDGDFKFNWNDAAAKEGNKVQTFMEKKYKYKGSDIVKSDVSLWNVISRRYQTSGLKRLFGEDEDE